MLRIREPDWHEHRVFKGPDTNVNLHVFSDGCPEIDRMLRFRDWLRTDQADRELYEQTKRELAAREWTYIQDYADAKTLVVEEIIARAPRNFLAGPEELLSQASCPSYVALVSWGGPVHPQRKEDHDGQSQEHRAGRSVDHRARPRRLGDRRRGLRG